jgi:Leucine-rich repeat (LRR) protein
LDLSHNLLDDLTPLTGLSQLQKLLLTSNRIKSLDPIVNLANLEWLVVNGNLLNTFENIALISSLQSVVMTGNQIDITQKKQQHSMQLITASVNDAHLLPQAPKSIFADIPGAKKREVDFDAELMNSR